MSNVLRNKKGYSTALLALLLPVLICVLGFAIDGGLIIYRTNELSSAVKIAAISATSIYEIDDEGEYRLTASANDVQELLNTNMDGAVLKLFSIDMEASGRCTVEGSSLGLKVKLSLQALQRGEEGQTYGHNAHFHKLLHYCFRGVGLNSCRSNYSCEKAAQNI